jgi:uncharacterized membrane protein YgdD (TMEM256/DUF423 family)
VTRSRLEQHPAAEQLIARLDIMFAESQSRVLQLVGSLVSREAAVMAYNDVFFVLGLALFAGLLLVPLLQRRI